VRQSLRRHQKPAKSGDSDQERAGTQDDTEIQPPKDPDGQDEKIPAIPFDPDNVKAIYPLAKTV
jgi:hypothetical protein